MVRDNVAVDEIASELPRRASTPALVSVQGSGSLSQGRTSSDCVKLACADHTGDKGRDGRLRCEDVLASMASNQGELVRSLDSLEREAPAMHAS